MDPSRLQFTVTVTPPGVGHAGKPPEGLETEIVETGRLRNVMGA